MVRFIWCFPCEIKLINHKDIITFLIYLIYTMYFPLCFLNILRKEIWSFPAAQKTCTPVLSPLPSPAFYYHSAYVCLLSPWKTTDHLGQLCCLPRFCGRADDWQLLWQFHSATTCLLSIKLAILGLLTELSACVRHVCQSPSTQLDRVPFFLCSFSPLFTFPLFPFEIWVDRHFLPLYVTSFLFWKLTWTLLWYLDCL